MTKKEKKTDDEIDARIFIDAYKKGYFDGYNFGRRRKGRISKNDKVYIWKLIREDCNEAFKKNYGFKALYGEDE